MVCCPDLDADAAIEASIGKSPFHMVVPMALISTMLRKPPALILMR